MHIILSLGESQFEKRTDRDDCETHERVVGLAVCVCVCVVWRPQTYYSGSRVQLEGTIRKNSHK
jgi:hypothetical protein